LLKGSHQGRDKNSKCNSRRCDESTALISPDIAKGKFKDCSHFAFLVH